MKKRDKVLQYIKINKRKIVGIALAAIVIASGVAWGVTKQVYINELEGKLSATEIKLNNTETNAHAMLSQAGYAMCRAELFAYTEGGDGIHNSQYDHNVCHLTSLKLASKYGEDITKWNASKFMEYYLDALDKALDQM